jgi:hypothetical protein
VYDAGKTLAAATPAISPETARAGATAVLDSGAVGAPAAIFQARPQAAQAVVDAAQQGAVQGAASGAVPQAVVLPAAVPQTAATTPMVTAPAVSTPLPGDTTGKRFVEVAPAVDTEALKQSVRSQIKPGTDRPIEIKTPRTMLGSRG